MTQETASTAPVTIPDDTTIHPFRVEFPREAIDDLRRRLAATRWPTKELVDDRSQGVQLATLRELASYWTSEYDFSQLAARLNAVPQFVTEIDGVEIHFIHVRSDHRNALPLIMTHGWPGSVIELLETIGPLTDPTAHGGSAVDAFDLVLPSLPGYGFSAGPDRARLGRRAGRTRLGANLCYASATRATSPRAAMWVPRSPTRWAARHPRD